MLSGDTYNLWFAPLRACALEDNALTLEVANDFCEVWLKDNYMGLLQDVVALAAGRQLQIKFKVGSASSIGTPAHAQNYPWCALYSGRALGGATNCGFTTFQQCLATVSGIGGFCEPNTQYRPPPGPHRRYRGYQY